MFTAENKAGSLQKEGGLILPRLGKIFPLFLIFLYFLFSSSELLHVVILIFKPKVSQPIAVFLLGYLCLIYRRIHLPRAIVYPFLWLLLSLVLSALLSAHSFRSYVYVGGYIFNFIFYFLIPVNLFNFFDSKTILRIYSLAFSCLGLYAFSQFVLSWFGIYDPFATQRVGILARGQGWTYEPSYYALYITSYVMYRNGLAMFETKTKSSFKQIIHLLGVNSFLLASTSAGVIFSYPAFFLVSFGLSIFNPIRSFVSYAKKRIVKCMMICTAFGAFLAWLFWDHFVLSFFKFFYFGFMAHGSYVARWEGLDSCFKVFLEYPFFGVGVGGVGPHLFIKHSFYDPYPLSLEEIESFDPTNVFTEILASLGLVGFIGFILLALVFYRSFKKVIVSAHVSQPDKIVAVALMISLFVMLFVLQFNQGLFRPYVWIHAGIVFGYLHRQCSTTNRTLV